MTKIFDALVAHNTGRSADLRPLPPWHVTHDMRKDTVYDLQYVYEVSATIKAKVMVPTYSGEDAKLRAYGLISHHVYEEFRGPIYEIRAALYANDMRGAEAALARLHDRMFVL